MWLVCYWCFVVGGVGGYWFDFVGGFGVWVCVCGFGFLVCLFCVGLLGCLVGFGGWFVLGFCD